MTIMKNKTFYFHGETVDGNRFTVSARIINYDDVLFGISICSAKDNFSRKKGRTISEGRLNKQLVNKSSNKGISIHSLYSDTFNKYRNEEKMYVKNYFIGIEPTVIQYFISNIQKFTKKKLQSEFSL